MKKQMTTKVEKLNRKLGLKVDTVRKLDEVDLEAVVGGRPANGSRPTEC